MALTQPRPHTRGLECHSIRTKPERHPPGALRLSTKEKAMGNAFGKNVMQARINALTMRSADSRALKTAKHIEENGLQENRSMRRHAKKEQQRMARSK